VCVCEREREREIAHVCVLSLCLRELQKVVKNALYVDKMVFLIVVFTYKCRC